MATASLAWIEYDGNVYEATTTDYTTYTKTLYGMNLGINATGTVSLYAQNTSGADSDTSLSLEVTTALVEAVSFIDSLLSNNWDTGNVALPTIVSGGESRQRHRSSTGDYIKVYRSPIPTKRTARFRRDYEYRDEFVQIMITTSASSPRQRLEDLKAEVIRIVNANATSPGSGWDKLWIDTVEVRKEFSEEFKAVADITLTKIIQAVNT